MAPVLGYWDIRGLAEHIRYMLAYAGVHYQDKRYSHGKAPDWSRDEWLADKFNLGLDFPNLPYYIDGDVKITQSVAITHYLARKHNLLPEAEADKVRVDVFEQQCMDILMSTGNLCYDPNYSEKTKQEWLKNFEQTAKLVSDFLAGKQFVAGDKVTFVDFLALETFDHIKFFDKNVYKNHPVIEEYIARVKELNGLKEYLASPKFKSWPVMSALATYGGEQHPEPK